MDIQRYKQRAQKGRQTDRQTLTVLFCSAAFQAGSRQAGRQTGRQEAGRQAVGAGGQKGWEENRKDGSKAGEQECRRAGIPADMQTVR